MHNEQDEYINYFLLISVTTVTGDSIACIFRCATLELGNIEREKN